MNTIKRGADLSLLVFVNVSFETDNQENSRIKSLAISFRNSRAHLHPYIINYIEDIIHDKCFFQGNKGVVCLWGGVYNYFDSKNFIEELKPFWLDLYIEGLIADFDRIVVFSGPEGLAPANAHVVRYDETSNSLYIAVHELAFRWHYAD